MTIILVTTGSTDRFHIGRQLPSGQWVQACGMPRSQTHYGTPMDVTVLNSEWRKYLDSRADRLVCAKCFPDRKLPGLSK